MSANTFILATKATLVSLNVAFADICVLGSFSPPEKVVERAAETVVGAIHRDHNPMVSSIDFDIDSDFCPVLSSNNDCLTPPLTSEVPLRV